MEVGLLLTYIESCFHVHEVLYVLGFGNRLLAVCSVPNNRRVAGSNLPQVTANDPGQIAQPQRRCMRFTLQPMLLARPLVLWMWFFSDARNSEYVGEGKEFF